MANTYSVSSVAQAAALAALDDLDHVQRAVKNNAEQAQVVSEGLSEFGYRVVPTSANFVYCDVRADASNLANRLRDEGICIRPMGAWGAPNHIRVTIGTPEQNQLFLKAAKKLAGR
jgi:histidinol-phosphate aminotransferase